MLYKNIIIKIHVAKFISHMNIIIGKNVIKKFVEINAIELLIITNYVNI